MVDKPPYGMPILVDAGQSKMSKAILYRTEESWMPFTENKNDFIVYIDSDFSEWDRWEAVVRWEPCGKWARDWYRDNQRKTQKFPIEAVVEINGESYKATLHEKIKK